MDLFSLFVNTQIKHYSRLTHPKKLRCSTCKPI